jgi:hypothetical protein
MFKVSLTTLAVFAFAAVSQAASFRDDFCGNAEIWFGGIYGRVQCNHKDHASAHFKFVGGEQHIWAYTNDLPHDQDANGRNPRTEVTLKNRHAYTKNDKAEFAGEVFVPSGTYAPFSFFQIKHDGTQGNTATSAMLNHQDGALRWYTGGQIFDGNMKGNWVPFRVSHNGPTGTIYVYINGVHVKSDQADMTVNNFYFKYGVYGKQPQNSVKEKFEARFRNIVVKINGVQAI